MLEKKGIFWFIVCSGLLTPALLHADEALMVSALQNTYSACVGIDDELADLKKMAGINTAITGVGTGLGAGATVVGLVKASKDKEMDEIDVKLQKLRELESANKTINPTEAEVEQFQKDFQNSYTSSIQEIERLEKEREELNKKSKSLGNWRTGLLAGNTATNIAGAIIAGTNRTDGDLQNQIDNCKDAIAELRRARAQARIDGIDVGEANTIISACEGFETVDISKINTRAKGAMISSAVGVATGLTGTITSGIANSDSVRNQGENGTRTDKEKSLNTAANVLAGASTVASATATVFNATQIKAIKDVANVAAKCTGVLK